MSKLLTDEFGQSFQLNDSDKSVVRGKDCLFNSIATVNSISTFLSTSLGPTGMDKILVDKDGGFTVTNDGFTIIKEMDMTNNPISQLILQLSNAQDQEIGDGTTSIVILASAILKEAKYLIENGIHPIKITEGFNLALRLAEEHLLKISEDVTDLNQCLLKAAKTALGSKFVSLGDFSGICVEAALAVADLNRKDFDLELVNIESSVGMNLSETKLIKGLVIKKEFSHPQMTRSVSKAKIALLSCPFEPPKLKNKNSLLISSVEEYKELEMYQKTKFDQMISSLKSCGANVVLCQWGFDDEANSLLMQNGIPAVRWVGGNDLGLIASHVNGSIIARFEDLNEESLGIADIKEESFGTGDDKLITIESPTRNKVVTIIVRGSTEYVIEEAKRSIRDALCAIRNVISCGKIVYGGGSCEISTSILLDKKAKEYSPEEEETIKAFSKALLEIPLTLAKNSGMNSIEIVEKIREQQITGNDYTVGIDCFETGEKNMKKTGIFETLKSKSRQLKMATDLVNTILKINEIIAIEE